MPFKKSFLLTLVILAGCGPARKLPKEPQQFLNPIVFHDIEIFDYTDIKTFSSLPLEGDSRDGKRFWSGDYWPLQKGNINQRWNAYTHMGQTRTSPDRSVVKLMRYEELAELSPSEKYDLFLGRYDYPLTMEVKERSKEEAKDWEGICNGWAVATSHHKEPNPKNLVNADGITIPFGSADIKALISYYYAYEDYHKVITTHQIGKRCDNNKHLFGINTPPECKDDVNPGSFHLALTNTIGMKQKSFLMDVNRYKEVWNHPVIAYTSKILDEDKTPGDKVTVGTVRTITMESRVHYIDESEKNTWYPINNTSEQVVAHKDYEYILYLNASDEVIGGQWKSGERPDFMWRMAPAYHFKGKLDHLGLLLND